MLMELVVAGVSRRGDGRSLVGYGAVSPGVWGFVRLMAPTPSGVLYPEHHRIGEWVEPRPFDLIRVETPWADSRPAQPENRVVDDTPWALLERPASRPHLARMERAPLTEGPLFGSTGRSVRSQGAAVGASILYVDVAPEKTAAVCTWDAVKGKFLSRIRFQADGTSYELPLTDWHYSATLKARGEGEYGLDGIGCRTPHGLRLLVTLGEAFHGWRYKTVEGLLPRRTVTLWQDAATTPFSHAIGNPVDRAMERPRAFVVGA